MHNFSYYEKCDYSHQRTFAYTENYSTRESLRFKGAFLLIHDTMKLDNGLASAPVGPKRTAAAAKNKEWTRFMIISFQGVVNTATDSLQVEATERSFYFSAS